MNYANQFLRSIDKETLINHFFRRHRFRIEGTEAQYANHLCILKNLNSACTSIDTMSNLLQDLLCLQKNKNKILSNVQEGDIKSVLVHILQNIYIVIINILKLISKVTKFKKKVAQDRKLLYYFF